MLRLALVNMPFAAWNRPSFALGQLATVIRRELGSDVSVDVNYLNLDFAEYLGRSAYESITEKLQHLHTGIGDWLFREIAFPDTTDNSDQYFRRFYRGDEWVEFRDLIRERRAGLREMCLDLIDRHRLADADVVGFTSMFAQNGANIAMAQLIKERNPDIVTIMGGANCEVPMGAVLAERVPALDYIFSGPSLDTLVAFMKYRVDDRLAEADEIPGILSQRNSRDPRFRKSIGADHDINDVLLPDYDSFFAALAEHPRLTETKPAGPTLFFETSRGCWWGERSHCTFCGLNGQSMNYRSMDPEKAVEQFNWLFGFASQCSSFYCTDNILPRSYPREVLSRLSTPPDVSIYYEVKLPLSRSDMATMATAGVNIVQPGIEALATSTLKLMGKGTTVFQNLQFLKNCVEYGIEPDWNLLIGFPGEPASVYEKYLQDLPLLSHLPPPHGVYMVRFDRFSPYFNRREEFGLDLYPMDYYGLIYPFNGEDLADLAYFFADHSLAPYQIHSAEHHDALRDLVAQWREAWQGHGGRTAARELRLLEDGPDGWTVRDSRFDTLFTHRVDAATRDLLRRLTSPVRRDQLLKGWSGGPDDLDRRLAWLREQGMLFTESDRMLGLVLGEFEPGEESGPEPAAELRQLPLTVIQRPNQP
ncbi:RiPP maturation radical SAM C-methyltransferase [Streptomyces canus]|uniref:RiPP maturation radical SAM C-methyltransferase n=1 Tax=Streptomyces canus TaxID=58343 RepID=UPI00036531A8|nr:RiPP maturation radical SAM C-methyltransferase [Streptomyces canus]